VVGTGGPNDPLQPVEDGEGPGAPSAPPGLFLDGHCLEQLRVLFQKAVDPVVMVEPSGSIVVANRAMHELCGYAPGELIGVRLAAIVPSRLHREYRIERVALLRGEIAHALGRRREYVLLRRDGLEVPVDAGVTVVRAASGPLLLAFVHDITERKASERQIRDTQARLVDMAFDASIAEERERRRIAADLHDRIGQSFAVVQMKITQARVALAGEARRALDEALGLIDQTITEMRTLIFDLSPPILYDLGLTAALAWLGENLEQRHGLHVAIDARDESHGLDPDVAALLFRTVRELLTNVIKHAGTASAAVSLRTDAESIQISVRDWGKGFDPAVVRQSGKGSFGLFSARQQVRRLGGTFVVDSAPGKGTLVRVRVPRTSIDGDEGEES
jgi:PAS domain S-box-containing protein